MENPLKCVGLQEVLLSKFDKKGLFMNWEDIILEFCMDITVRGFSKITIKNYKSKLRKHSKFFQINKC